MVDGLLLLFPLICTVQKIIICTAQTTSTHTLFHLCKGRKLVLLTQVVSQLSKTQIQLYILSYMYTFVYIKKITFLLKVSKTCLYLTVTFRNPILELGILSICPTVGQMQRNSCSIFKAQDYLILSAKKFKMHQIWDYWDYLG